MPRIITQSTIAASTASHAPSVNLVASTITRTRPVTTAPSALITRAVWWRRRGAGSRSVRSSLFQCRTMPSWESVKAVNTPRM